MSVFVSTDVTSGARPSIPALVALSVAGSVVLFLILSVSDTVLALLILPPVLFAVTLFCKNALTPQKLINYFIFACCMVAVRGARRLYPRRR